MTPEFKETVNQLRADILVIGSRVGKLVEHSGYAAGASIGSPNACPQEMIENTILSFRHLEDARMRLGKVLQAMEGGESIYDMKPGSDSAVPNIDPGDTGNPPGDNLPSRLR